MDAERDRLGAGPPELGGLGQALLVDAVAVLVSSGEELVGPSIGAEAVGEARVAGSEALAEGVRRLVDAAGLGVEAEFLDDALGEGLLGIEGALGVDDRFVDFLARSADAVDEAERDVRDVRRRFQNIYGGW